MKCYTCGMVFLNPVFRDDYLERYYEENHTLQAELVSEDMEFYGRIYGEGLDLVESAGTDSGQLLDFGCSSGIFLDISKARGFSTFGLELNKSESAMAADKGHTVFMQPIEQCDFQERFDIITLWDVFEHLKDGGHFLALFRSLLNEQGCIFIQTPSSDALAARIMREKCNMFDGLEHVNIYNPETISQLAEKNGYFVTKIKTVIPEMHVLENYLNYEPPYHGERIPGDYLLPLIDEEYILENRLGYKMQIVLRKL